MKGYHDDIERQTTDNSDFRRVLYTGKTSAGADEPAAGLRHRRRGA